MDSTRARITVKIILYSFTHFHVQNQRNHVLMEKFIENAINDIVQTDIFSYTKLAHVSHMYC